MNTDQFAGTARSIGGRIEEAAGDVMNDSSLRADGLVDQVKGAAQNLYGDAKEKVQDAYVRVVPPARENLEHAIAVTRENPVLAMLAAGAVGFALAFALRGADGARRGF